MGRKKGGRGKGLEGGGGGTQYSGHTRERKSGTEPGRSAGLFEVSKRDSRCK